MNLYDPSLRTFRVPSLAGMIMNSFYIEMTGIPEGLEKHETVRLITKSPALMYKACVVDICEVTDRFWLTFERNDALWT